MASEPVINYDDLPTAARDIYREYGGPKIILKMADEIEKLQKTVKAADAVFERLGFDVKSIAREDIAAALSTPIAKDPKP